MKILFIGDISGRPGRNAVKKILPNLIKQKKIDFIIANAENAAGGRGVNQKVLNELQSYGIDFFTSGEHIWDHKKMWETISFNNFPIIRPFNYDGNAFIPGKGYRTIKIKSQQIIVMNFVGQIFMNNTARNPFWAFDELWKYLQEQKIVQNDKNPIVIIDFHAEATSEKICFAWHIRNRASAVLGTHTHVPTADEKILDKKIAFVTDVGMCGPKQASLWVDFESAVNNFRFPTKKSFKMKKRGKKIFNSVLIEFKENLPVSIIRIDKNI